MLITQGKDIGTYAGEPDKLVAELAEDEAIAAADTRLLSVPNSCPCRRVNRAWSRYREALIVVGVR